MKLFDEAIVNILNEYFAKGTEHVESVLLASYGINFQFASFNVQCNERVFGFINSETYTWEDAPNPGPWGAFGRQVATQASLESPSLLAIRFSSGDSLGIETVENQYESVIFTFPPQGEALVMEIY